jgi:hypothetical protein
LTEVLRDDFCVPLLGASIHALLIPLVDFLPPFELRLLFLAFAFESLGLFCLAVLQE